MIRVAVTNYTAPQMPRKAPKGAAETVRCKPIFVTAGTLQASMRTEPACMSAALVAPFGQPHQIMSMLEAIPPCVWQPEPGIYRVGGLRGITRALVPFLDPEIEIPCLEYPEKIPEVSVFSVAMLVKRLVCEADFQQWISRPENWRQWFVTDGPTGVTFGQLFGVKAEKGRQLLRDAQRTGRSAATDPLAVSDDPGTPDECASNPDAAATTTAAPDSEDFP